MHPIPSPDGTLPMETVTVPACYFAKTYCDELSIYPIVYSKLADAVAWVETFARRVITDELKELGLEVQFTIDRDTLDTLPKIE